MSAFCFDYQLQSIRNLNPSCHCGFAPAIRRKPRGDLSQIRYGRAIWKLIDDGMTHEMYMAE